MKIHNKTKRETIEAPLSGSFFGEFLGLMFWQSGKKLFRVGGSVKIHTYFCRPMELYFFSGKIVEKTELNPWGTYENEKDAEWLLESTEELGWSVGDNINI